MHPITTPCIEPLESRIAPAAVLSFQDIDGDIVTIKSSVGTNAELLTAVLPSNGGGLTNLDSPTAPTNLLTAPHELHDLQLDSALFTGNSPFNGAKITITAKQANPKTAPKGDGFVNVGEISATGIDLASVTVGGDLGKIVVGKVVASGTTSVPPALGSLKVHSMGKFGTATQGTGGGLDLISRFENGVKSIAIATDADGVLLRAISSNPSSTLPADQTAKIGSVFIGGSLIGESGSDTGEINAVDGIGTVKILGNIIGGSGSSSGRVDSDGVATPGVVFLKSVFVGGSVVGGTAADSGEIQSGAAIGSIIVKGDLVGGTAFDTGHIQAGNIGSVIIGRSVIGGSFGSTGGIDVANTLKSAVIGGNMQGTAITSTSNFTDTAYIDAATVDSVLVGGSIISGTETGGGKLSNSGAIIGEKNLGTVTVLQDIVGSSTNQVVISGKGSTATVKGKPVVTPAIKSITIDGSMDYGLILGGFNAAGNTVNGDAQIDSVVVKGDLIATSIVAGVVQSPFFGDPTDALFTPNTGLSKIGKVTVGGEIIGTVATGDRFGIEAHSIGSVSTGGTSLPIPAIGSSTDLSGSTNFDVHIRQLA